MKRDPKKYSRTKLSSKYKYEDRYTTQNYPGTFMPTSTNRRYRHYSKEWLLPPGFLDKVIGQPRAEVEAYINERVRGLPEVKRLAVRQYLGDMIREEDSWFLHLGVACYYTPRGVMPLPEGVYYYDDGILHMVPVDRLPNGRRKPGWYIRRPYLNDRYIQAVHIHLGAAMVRAIFKVHTGESLAELEALEYQEQTPDPPRLNHLYKWLEGQHTNIPMTWWATDLEVIPQVGWYVRPPMDPVEGMPWGLDVMVIRIRLRDNHLEITCRVVYEEG